MAVLKVVELQSQKSTTIYIYILREKGIPSIIQILLSGMQNKILQKHPV